MGIITIDAVFLIIGTALIIGIIILLLIMLNKCRRMAKKQRNLINKIKESNKTAEIRRKFFAKISHEMRTPLNIIIGLSELELGSFDDEQGESNPVLEKIYSAGMNLLSIINDLLDITKLESGKLRLIPAIYDISSLINDTMNMNILKIGSKPIQFRLHVDSNLPSYLEGDRLRVKQVFSNLISNAIKFTNSGFVDWNITCKREEDRVKIISTVSDTGIGIRKEKIEKLFDKNIYSMDFKANNYNEGIGMGISITNDLVTLMGGTISVKSEQGTGSVFTVEFYQKVIGDEIIGEKLAETLSEFKYLERRRSINRKIFRANMSYATVLVVDDVITNL
ncbi:MAG: ATP-binding protein, partial [Treponema sp.]|nr:ATP-binding protein [Treponema sp.]